MSDNMAGLEEKTSVNQAESKNSKYKEFLTIRAIWSLLTSIERRKSVFFINAHDHRYVARDARRWLDHPGPCLDDAARYWRELPSTPTFFEFSG